MLHPKVILRIIGLLLQLEALFLTCSVALSLYYNEQNILSAYIYTIAALVGSGLLLTYIGYNKERNISRKDGYIVVTLCWVIFSLYGAMPYYISGYIPSITDAFFETMAGFTTTGASVVVDFDEFPRSLVFWRIMTQWIGGLGIVFFTVAVLPIFGLGDLHLFAAETIGIARAKLHPRISVTARWIMTIYVCLTLLEAICLKLAGMGYFDAICHAMSTMSTGGISTKSDGISSFNSPTIEYIITVFMIMGGTSFSLLYLAMFKRRPQELFRDAEFRTYIMVMAVFTLAIGTGLYITEDMSVESSFRTSLFQVVSVVTTTGFSTVNYSQWTPVLWLLLSAAMFVGACSGSTTGGMKSIRVAVLGRVMENEFKRIVHPNAVIPVRLGGKIISEQIQSAVMAFTLLYVGMVVVGIFINMLFGLNLVDAYGLSLSSVSNVGPGLGNYSSANAMSTLPDTLKWFYCFQMLVGRLEFFAVLLLLTPVFWRRQ
ncbi:MAG: TrkH family potassium uptake protein [Bacteroidaceae bacterium]|nr:TrkH family potassium uptake protein [Bacteroidaceae bacterium]